MNISKVAELTGVSAKTIRYYESIGLMPEPERAPNGYRDYSDKEIQTLRFIQSSRQLGFPLKDVANLLELWQDKGRASRDVRELAINHIAEIETKIQELQAIRDSLKDLVNCCNGDDRPDCPILKGLEKDLTKDADCGCETN